MFENRFFLVTNDLNVHVSKLVLWYLNTFVCPLLMWQLELILDCIWWTGKSVTNAFPRSTDIIQVENKLPTDERHIKVPQDSKIDDYALHTSTRKK